MQCILNDGVAGGGQKKELIKNPPPSTALTPPPAGDNEIHTHRTLKDAVFCFFSHKQIISVTLSCFYVFYFLHCLYLNKLRVKK